MDGTTEEAATASSVPLPPDPNTEDVALHKLTHLPYISWCKVCVCVEARRKRNYSKAITGSKPVVQSGYTFLVSATTGNRILSSLRLMLLLE